MLLNGAQSQDKGLRDGGIRFTLGHIGKYLPLARGETGQRRVGGSRPLPDQCLDYLRVDDRPTLRDLPDSREQLIYVRHALL